MHSDKIVLEVRDGQEWQQPTEETGDKLSILGGWHFWWIVAKFDGARIAEEDQKMIDRIKALLFTAYEIGCADAAERETNP